MAYQAQVQRESFVFDSLKDLLAKASPHRSADALAGIGSVSERERVAAQLALADVPLKKFLSDLVISYETDEITRLIVNSHDPIAFEPIAHLTVGEFRDWLLSESCTSETLCEIRFGITPEMVAAVSKLMKIQDLVLVAKKCQIITAFRNHIGMPGRFSTRLQPNHPTDDLRGILASTIDGLAMGNGDAVIGINPSSDNLEQLGAILKVIDDLRHRLQIPTQTCILTHITQTLRLIERKQPVDLVFQSIAGTELANAAFGVNLNLLAEAQQAAQELKRGTVGSNLMYFETGQGSCLSSNTHHGVDAQTLEVRAYAVARHFQPLLVNSVVGFIGPEYLYNGKQIIRAGLEDHFSGKLLGLPMGCDICYTNHTEADGDDMDVLLTLLAAAGCTFIMGIPGSDDVMLNYQSTSFHDALYIRSLLKLRPAPEFERWLENMGLWDEQTHLLKPETHKTLLNSLPKSFLLERL